MFFEKKIWLNKWSFFHSFDMKQRSIIIIILCTTLVIHSYIKQTDWFLREQRWLFFLSFFIDRQTVDSFLYEWKKQNDNRSQNSIQFNKPRKSIRCQTSKTSIFSVKFLKKWKQRTLIKMSLNLDYLSKLKWFLNG